jgi:membrane peptidoglycan carboxypeptidase
LGGAEVNLLEHTSAYATLANNGERFPTASILEIKNSRIFSL